MTTDAPVPARITPADLHLLNTALIGKREADAAYVFAMRHLASVYGLEEGDSINEGSGEIIRGKPSARAKPKPLPPAESSPEPTPIRPNRAARRSRTARSS